MPHSQIWIQSLLLLSARPSPVISLLAQQRMKEAGIQEVQRVTGAISEEDPVTGLEVISIFQRRTVMASSDSPRPLAHWPLTVQPRASFLEVLGNGLVTTFFPYQVHCVLQAVICGEGAGEFSWTLDGPLGEGRQASRLITSRRRQLEWRALTYLPAYQMPSSLRMSIIREPVTFVAPESGLYLITAYLNGGEASYLPLVILHEREMWPGPPDMPPATPPGSGL
ncbi:hypothetical protein [Thermogemmatispora sp.]|uniref:hypothetical protein n=1 Tax=Thermogemmatispora sp. TaxID=1968838 RepID=UPI001D9BF2F8|nr:hypothetical protein [Thermogemmatispora sp.]MBX5450900.1 hypothetical protein [Thermogemmatispora sp.]